KRRHRYPARRLSLVEHAAELGGDPRHPARHSADRGRRGLGLSRLASADDLTNNYAAVSRYCEGDSSDSMKREYTHPVSWVAGSVTCPQLPLRPITRSFSPFCAIRSVSAVCDGAFRRLTETESATHSFFAQDAAL